MGSPNFAIMKLTTFFILSLSLVALSQQKALRDPVDDFLKQILELLKQMMAEGNPALGIPVLDPFEVPHFDNLTGNILGLIPLYGDGEIWLEIYDLDLSASAAVVINEQGFVKVTTMTLSAAFSSIKIHLENLLNLLGDYIWDQLKDILFPLLESVLTDVINDALDGCSIAELIETGACFRDNMNRMRALLPAPAVK